MILYTVQEMYTLDCLKEIGFYAPTYDAKEVIFDAKDDGHWSLYDSYEWLKTQMEHRKIHYDNYNRNMIWAYRSYYKTVRDGKITKPSLFKNEASFGDRPYVLMEIDIPDNRVLLSDYIAWHHVLNAFTISKTNEFMGLKFDRSNLNEVSKNWHVIFDIPKIRRWMGVSKNNQDIQATFFELYFTDLKRAWIFENNKITKIENY